MSKSPAVALKVNVATNHASNVRTNISITSTLRAILFDFVKVPVMVKSIAKSLGYTVTVFAVKDPTATTRGRYSFGFGDGSVLVIWCGPKVDREADYSDKRLTGDRMGSFVSTYPHTEF